MGVIVARHLLVLLLRPGQHHAGDVLVRYVRRIGVRPAMDLGDLRHAALELPWHRLVRHLDHGRLAGPRLPAWVLHGRPVRILIIRIHIGAPEDVVRIHRRCLQVGDIGAWLILQLAARIGALGLVTDEGLATGPTAHHGELAMHRCVAAREA